MKKVLITALLVSLALGAFAQAVDTSMIDMSKAELNLAGPDSVYITDIYYGGARVSVLLRYNGGTGATIYGPYSDNDKLLLDSFELGEASIRQTGRNSLVISDLILYGAGVSGRLQYDGAYTLDLTSWWQQSDTPVAAEAQVATLTAQIATAQTRYEQELTATKAKFANDLAEAEAASDETIADLEAEVKAAEAEISKLETRIAMGGGGMAATHGAAAGSSIDPRSVDISQLDVSDAMMHLAGPDTIYVTDIEYGGVAMSILLKYDGKQGALIYGPYFDENKLLLDSFELGYAKLRLQGNDTLVISDLLLYGTGVSGRFAYDGVYTLNLSNWWQTSGPKTSEMRIAELEAQSDTTALMASIKAAEAERDAAVAELATAEADLAEAMADLEAAKAENSRLALRLSMDGGGMAATHGAAGGSSIDPRSVDISQIDLSNAMMHLAGPDTIYLTDIEYSGVAMSILLKYDGKQGALIYGPYFDDNKLLLDSFQLGYANLRLQGSDTLIISDLILYGTGISGRLEYDGVYTLNLSSWWETMTPKTNEMKVAELETQMDAAERRYERELAAASRKIAGLERQLASGAGVAMVEKPTRTTDLESEIVNLAENLQLVDDAIRADLAQTVSARERLAKDIQTTYLDAVDVFKEFQAEYFATKTAGIEIAEDYAVTKETYLLLEERFADLTEEIEATNTANETLNETLFGSQADLDVSLQDQIAQLRYGFIALANKSLFGKLRPVTLENSARALALYDEDSSRTSSDISDTMNAEGIEINSKSVAWVLLAYRGVIQQ